MKLLEINDVMYDEIIENIEGYAADALWLEINYDFPECSYEERKQLYLSVMYRLMKEGRLKLSLQGQYCEGTIEEQVQRYAAAWPEEELLCHFDFQFVPVGGTAEDPVAAQFWVPGFFVWFYEDGFIEASSGS